MENLDFDTAISRLENILDKLENDQNLSAEETQKLYEEAEQLKDHCKNLLSKEREEIVRVAKENNISLDELDLDQDYDDDDDEDDDEDEEDEEK